MSTTSLSLDRQVPRLLRHMEVALRSGYSLKQALEIAARDMEPPMSAEAQRVLEALSAGSALSDALDAWRRRAGSADLDLFVAAVQVQLEVGGNLADKLQLLAQILEKRARPSAG